MTPTACWPRVGRQRRARAKPQHSAQPLQLRAPLPSPNLTRMARAMIAQTLPHLLVLRLRHRRLRRTPGDAAACAVRRSARSGAGDLGRGRRAARTREPSDCAVVEPHNRGRAGGVGHLGRQVAAACLEAVACSRCQVRDCCTCARADERRLLPWPILPLLLERDEPARARGQLQSTILSDDLKAPQN
jgi:hypothetical protein